MDLPRGVDARPTAARVRGAIFDRLQVEVAGTHVLDLFAGSGALALEALSRGARSATLVERERVLVHFLEEQVRALGLESVAQVHQEDALAFLRRGPGAQDERYDLVLVDPPYDRPELHVKVSAGLCDGAWLSPGAVVVFEREQVRGKAPPVAWPDQLTVEARRRHGQTVLDFLRMSE
jgi:16S rRNA (guanine966-N2)-methyltransferase